MHIIFIHKYIQIDKNTLWFKAKNAVSSENIKPALEAISHSFLTLLLLQGQRNSFCSQCISTVHSVVPVLLSSWILEVPGFQWL